MNNLIQVPKETLLHFAEDVSTTRPEPRREIDQILMWPYYMAIQTDMMSSHVFGKDILFIGDGDHISVMISEFCKPRSVTVVDIDPRIVSSINNWGEKLGCDLRAIEYDVFNSLPSDLVEKFDLFYTNPPYGSKNKGQSLNAFLKRGIEGVKEDSYGILISAYDHQRLWSIDGFSEVEKFMVEQGFVIEEKVNGVHKYKLEGDPELTSAQTVFFRKDHIIPKWQGMPLEKIDKFY